MLSHALYVFTSVDAGITQEGRPLISVGDTEKPGRWLALRRGRKQPD